MLASQHASTDCATLPISEWHYPKTKTDQVQKNLMCLVGNAFYMKLAHQLAPLLSAPGVWALQMTEIVCGHQV